MVACIFVHSELFDTAEQLCERASMSFSGLSNSEKNNLKNVLYEMFSSVILDEYNKNFQKIVENIITPEKEPTYSKK